LYRDQSLTFDLYKNHIPSDLTGLKVLDLGANACGFSIEFAKRGAQVVAVELEEKFINQAKFIVDYFGLADKITIECTDLYRALSFGKFDIICYVGLSYHIRHPQLALDMLSNICTGWLLASSQTITGSDLAMVNRASKSCNRVSGELHGWEPTETLFQEMIFHAGFVDCKLLSTSPHPGETDNRILGNRSYYIARAGSVTALPFVNELFVGKPEGQY
jgi:SAM-dependent methyltransferase